jgi:hypothetical protein
MVFLTLFVIGVLCPVFKSTRIIGVIGSTFLLLLYPIAFILLLVIGCLGLFIQFKFSRRALNVYTQPKLPS